MVKQGDPGDHFYIIMEVCFSTVILGRETDQNLVLPNITK